MKQPKIIIDTDPGIDDAMAILLAHLAPDIELIGLTTVFGNVPVAQATHNACILSDLMGGKVPVAAGSAHPLNRTNNHYPDFVHGKNGFGDTSMEPPVTKAIEQGAVDFIIEQISQAPGEITLVPIGPLTNIAKALEKAPGIASQVKGVILMGGAATVNGNVNAAAEANMLSDPHAADHVFTTDWPITMVGLDVTHKIIMDEAYLDRVHQVDTPIGGFLRRIVQFYLDFHRSTGIDGLYTHDPAAIVYLLKPEIFTVRKGAVRVCTDGIAAGQTIMNLSGRPYLGTAWDGIPTSDACVDVDITACLEWYADIMSGN
jgi:inosine-uridine nucleoside N-ribohydrolase